MEENKEFKKWMANKLAERNMSLATFVVKTGHKITRTTVFHWYNGKFQASYEKMDLVCKTLSDLPIIEGDHLRYEHVPLHEGIALFSPGRRD